MTERINRILGNPLFLCKLDQICEREKDRVFCGHDADHLLSVARTAALIAADEGLSVERELLYAAALLHDLGRADAAEQHELRSAALAQTILTECGYAEDEQKIILEAIAEHRSSWQGRRGVYGELLYRADKESRPCFACAAADCCSWPDSKKNLTIVY